MVVAVVALVYPVPRIPASEATALRPLGYLHKTMLNSEDSTENGQADVKVVVEMAPRSSWYR